jgi:hypothetical protein
MQVSTITTSLTEIVKAGFTKIAIHFGRGWKAFASLPTPMKAASIGITAIAVSILLYKKWASKTNAAPVSNDEVKNTVKVDSPLQPIKKFSFNLDPSESKSSKDMENPFSAPKSPINTQPIENIFGRQNDLNQIQIARTEQLSSINQNSNLISEYEVKKNELESSNRPENEAEVMQFAQRNPKLEEIDLSDFKGLILTDYLMVFTSCTHLKSINLKSNAINNDVISALITYCNRLNHINLSDTSITNTSLKMILRSKTTIRTLNISGCKGITAAELPAIIVTNPKVKFILRKDDPSVTELGRLKQTPKNIIFSDE